MPEPKIQVGQPRLGDRCQDRHCEASDEELVDRLFGIALIPYWLEGALLQPGNPVAHRFDLFIY